MKKIYLVLAAVMVINLSFIHTEILKAFTESYLHENENNYDKAISDLRSIYDVNSYEINLRLGWLYYANGEYVTAQNYYKNAIKIFPNSIEAMLGFAYPTAELGEWESIIKTYNKILSIDPNNYTTMYRMAHIYYERKDFKQAQTFAKKVNEQYPFDFYINLLLAKINIDTGNKVEAKLFLENAINYDPSSEEAAMLLKKL